MWWPLVANVCAKRGFDSGTAQYFNEDNLSLMCVTESNRNGKLLSSLQLADK
jgi:hypothetical protein